MLRSFRFQSVYSDVVPSNCWAVDALHVPPVRRVLRVRKFSFTRSLPSPSKTSPRQISVFFPHEELKIKALKTLQRKTAKLTAADSVLGHKSSKSAKSISRIGGEIISSHYDLTSYSRFHQARLNDARDDPDKRLALDTSYVHLGTRYEYLTQSHLQSQLGFSLTRIGGKGDGGVDLIGTWTVPLADGHRPSKGSGARFRVFLQAKRFAPHRKPSPSLMREVEGTLMSAPGSRSLKEAFAAHLIRVGSSLTQGLGNAEDINGDDDADFTFDISLDDRDDLLDLGILVTTRPLSEGMEKAMANSRRCLMYIYLEEHPFDLPSSSRGRKTTSPADTPADNETVDEVDDSSERDDDLLSEEAAQSPVADNGNGSPSKGSAITVPRTKIRQIAWNAAASRAGLEGYGVVMRYNQPASASEGTMDSEAVLAYQGRPVKVSSEAS